MADVPLIETNITGDPGPINNAINALNAKINAVPAATPAAVVDALDAATLPVGTVDVDTLILGKDPDDSGALKTYTAQSIADLAGGGGGGNASAEFTGEVEMDAAVNTIDIPADAFRVTIQVKGATLPLAVDHRLRLVTGGGTAVTGYDALLWNFDPGQTSSSTDKFLVTDNASAVAPGAYITNAVITLTLTDRVTNTWSMTLNASAASGSYGPFIASGTISLPGALTQIAYSGDTSDTDVFTAGTMYAVVETVPAA